MRKSFRVATVFTGAAACAAVFAPAAGAAPVAPGATGEITPKAVTGNNCTAGEWNWTHMWYTTSEKHSIAACFAGTGTYPIPGNKKFSYFCAGNNSGSLNTNYGYLPFWAGSKILGLSSAVVHSVRLWHHNDPSARC